MTLGKITITNGGTTVSLGGECRVEHRHRAPAQDIPGGTGDKQQGLGRKSRVIVIPNGSIYEGADATDITKAQQLRTWIDAFTTVTVVTLTESLSMKIHELDIIEGRAKGFNARIILMEVN